MEANLLVVKNEIYSPIAKVCIESFLYFHPKSRVKVHVDRVTIHSVKALLKELINRGKVEIQQIVDEDFPWQRLKLKLILSLGNTEKFFMDADLKWSGPMPRINSITLFVEEFRFRDNFFYLPLMSSKYFENCADFTMKNTSFFYWGGHEPEQHYENRILEIMGEILKVAEDPNNSTDFNMSTKRICEQIALSLFLENTGEEVCFLKQVDQFKGKSFVESSYFGATGWSF